VDFYRYSISDGTWSTMAPAPGDISYDANLAYPGTGDFIYSNRGANRADFYAYSISNNVWSTKAASRMVVTIGSFLVSPGSGDYLYEKNGNLMFRYSLSGNSWNSTPLPFIPGGTLGAFASTGNGNLYNLLGNASLGFFRYAIADNSWAVMAAPPNSITQGSLVYPGSGDYLYAFRGHDFNGIPTNNFFRYSISANTWTTMASAPGAISYGGALVYPGSGDYIYGYQGGGSTAFYRYSISGNTWTTMAVTPAAISHGGFLVYPSAGDYIYGYQGGWNTGFYRYSISDNSWATMTAVPRTVGNSTALTYPGSGDFLYGTTGHRYSISSNSWIDELVAKSTLSSLVYPGSGDYLYAGSGSTLARYSLTESAAPKFWEQVPVNNNSVSVSFQNGNLESHPPGNAVPPTGNMYFTYASAPNPHTRVFGMKCTKPL
jgi:hypothetical protein